MNARHAPFNWKLAEHGSEVELDLAATSAVELFAVALEAFSHLVDDGGPGEAACHAVSLTASDLQLLLVTWLDELVYLAEVEDFIPAGVERLEVSRTTLSATLTGRRGKPLHLVKAVTLHDLEVECEGGDWHGRVVLDV